MCVNIFFSRCVVSSIIYKFFTEKRPSSTLTHRFIWRLKQVIHLNKHSLVKKWLKSSPLGINTINALLKGMVERYLPNSTGRRLTNHSVRKSCVQALKDQNLPNTDIIAITGHKRSESINTYSTLNNRNHKKNL